MYTISIKKDFQDEGSLYSTNAGKSLNYRFLNQHSSTIQDIPHVDLSIAARNINFIESETYKIPNYSTSKDGVHVINYRSSL